MLTNEYLTTEEPLSDDDLLSASYTGVDPEKVRVALPNKLSDLLEVAVKDARLLARTPGYRLRMSRWYDRDSDGVCNVCLAGAVMANTCEIPKPPRGGGSSYSAWYFLSGRDEHKMSVINDLREGWHRREAVRKILEPIRNYRDANRTRWRRQARAPWSLYEKAVKDLRAAGF